jgi:hypothetical protein
VVLFVLVLVFVLFVVVVFIILVVISLGLTLVGVVLPAVLSVLVVHRRRGRLAMLPRVQRRIERRWVR